MEADLWHEVMHAILNRLGYKEHDEKYVEELAQSLYAFIKDNSELFEIEAGGATQWAMM